MRNIKYLQITILGLIGLNIFMIVFWMNDHKNKVNNSTHHKNHLLTLDTLEVSDSTFFKIRREGSIKTIELYIYSKLKDDATLIETIDFHSNGCVKKIETIGLKHSKKKMKDGSVYMYNVNTLLFDNSLNLESYYLTKNYNVVANSEEQLSVINSRVVYQNTIWAKKENNGRKRSCFINSEGK